MRLPRSDQTRLSPDQALRIAEECYCEVLAYCRRHALAGHEPADLAQEVFLRFVRAQGYRDRGKPIAYLMRIARSVCVDASRERQLETVSLDFDVPATDAEDERGKGIGDAVAQLPGELREAIELRYGSGLKVNEVARVLGISRFAARRRINRALELLKNKLEEDDLDG
ncbi:MAG: sigma-70 family RNA polymerase sigma factor [Atopobiaceae bacterium]|nr:sigma-70 family RNA polymerase sigma factor [Atopobiaceae bacterium]